jgi:L-asparagine transporter-like permease
MNAINPAEVGRMQRWLILAILLHIILLFVWIFLLASQGQARPDPQAAVTMLPLNLARLVVGIATIVILVMLMAALQRPIVSRILAAISQFIPLVGLIVLLVVNQRATRTLREAGYHVGLMGARAK